MEIKFIINNTKKAISLLLFLLITSAAAFAQVEQQHYIYGIVSINGDLDQNRLTVDFDDGKTVKRLKNENGENIKVATPAAIITYFASKGWQLCSTSVDLVHHHIF